MSKKDEVISLLLDLSTWSLEAAFAIEDDELAGMAGLEADFDWLEDLVAEIDEALFDYFQSGRQQAASSLHKALMDSLH